MDKQRTPEFDDIEELKSIQQISATKDQLSDAEYKMQKAFGETQPFVPSDNTLNILVIDDNKLFLESLQEASKGLNMEIQIWQPNCVTDAKQHILKIFKKQNLDCVLLDFAYEEKAFTGLDILRTLRSSEEKTPISEQSEDDIKLRYLPVAIVTRGGSEGNIDCFDPDEVLGAGADKVYSEKGFGHGDFENIKKEEKRLSSRPLLNSLRTGGFKEMQFRAWARLWQDLRDQLEEQIKFSLDNNQWLNRKAIEEALNKSWGTISRLLIPSGYADHLSMRILHYSNNSKCWELKKLGSNDCPDYIPWDAIIFLKKCLEEKSQSIHIFKELSKDDLIDPQYQNILEIEKFKRLKGRSAIAARLDSKISPVGTLLLTREKNRSPFSAEDKTHLRITVERLGLFYRELHLRYRHHKRQMALIRLGRDIMHIDDENIIVAKAVKALHIYLHHSRGAFTANAHDNPATNGRVSIRLIEPGTGRLMRPAQALCRKPPYIARWVLGFDTGDVLPSLITVDSDQRYKKLIEKGVSQFISSPSKEEIDDNRKDKTHAKMLVPIKAGSVVIGTINVEHQQEGFYGKKKNSSADFTLLQGIALEVGQALRSLRARRMLRKLLQLHQSTGEKEQIQVIANLMGVLYDYTGCAVGMWVEPEGDSWKISGVWECEQGYKREAPPPREFKSNHKFESKRMEKWQNHFEKYFDQSLIGRKINCDKDHESTNSSFHYDDEGFPADKNMRINTLSQAALILRDPATHRTLGAFGFMFNQKPGLDIKHQAPLLQEAADFAASYLSIRNKNKNYLLNSQIMEQQAGLGLAYQQLRHSIKLHLGGVNGKLDRILDKLDDDAHIQEIKGFLNHISRDIKISKSMMKLPDLQAIDVKTVWNQARIQFEDHPVSLEIEITEMIESIWVYADPDLLIMVFTNLIDNALYAMKNKIGIKKISCLSFPEIRAGYIFIAICDTGPGIPQETATLLFDKIGVSTKATGTGFGTYFSAYMLRRSKANIRYDRHYKDGAQFILSFPIIPAKKKSQ